MREQRRNLGLEPLHTLTETTGNNGAIGGGGPGTPTHGSNQSGATRCTHGICGTWPRTQSVPRRAAAHTWCPGSTARRMTPGRPGHRQKAVLPPLVPQICAQLLPTLPRGNHEPPMVAFALPSPRGVPAGDPGDTYKTVAGTEGAIGHHAKAGRAVSRGTAVWAETSLAY